MIIYLETGGASLRCYSWDHLGDHPLLFTLGTIRQISALCLTLSCTPLTTFTIVEKMPSLGRVVVSHSKATEIMKKVILGVKIVRRSPQSKTSEMEKRPAFT